MTKLFLAAIVALSFSAFAFAEEPSAPTTVPPTETAAPAPKMEGVPMEKAPKAKVKKAGRKHKRHGKKHHAG